MSGFGTPITNPTEALIHVGKENSQLHEEVAALYAEIDGYRRGLTAISEMPTADITGDPTKPGIIARMTLSRANGLVIKTG